MNKKERTRETVSLFMNIVIIGITIFGTNTIDQEYFSGKKVTG